MARYGTVSRRNFLAGSGAGALVVTLGAPSIAEAQTAGPVALGAFLRITADNRVTAIIPCVEMGQGSHTALAMILADELGADWSTISVVPPPVDAIYRTPGRAFQNTSGSQMVRRWDLPLRKSAAAAREMLIAAAARRWKVEPSTCTAGDGEVRHAASGRALRFGALASEAAGLAEPKDPVLRSVKTIVGTNRRRLDIPAKVDGSAVYGIDVRLPDMVHAAVRQAPVFGAKVLSVDEAPARAMKGVLSVVLLPGAVAVVATSFWIAKKAVDALSPVYSHSQNDLISSADIMKSQRIQLDSPVFSTGVETGDCSSIRAPGARLHSADYTVPFLHHATMEPMTCTAHLGDDRFEFWVPTQNLTGVQQVGAKVSGLAPEKIVVNATLLGGGYGRKFEQDFVEQAALIAKAVRRPVKLVWTREEDVQHGFYRPAMTARLTAELDDAGRPRALVLRSVGPSVVEHTIGQPFVGGIDPVALLGVSTETPASPSRIQQYSIPNFRAEYIYQPTHVPIGYWRSVGASQNGFFIESFIDELAALAGRDPYLYRKDLLRESPRALAVLDRVASEAGWRDAPAAGRHRGIAFSECVGSMFAAVVEISMSEGRPVVHRIVCAIDCGRAVHPENVVRQVEGCVQMGLNSAMVEQITITDGRCAQSNFHDYPLLRLTACPRIDVHVVESGAALGGVGEAGVPAIAPAIANAVFAATGRRIRSLPLQDQA